MSREARIFTLSARWWVPSLEDVLAVLVHVLWGVAAMGFGVLLGMGFSDYWMQAAVACWSQ